jgi:Asp-tRNA(Asn)/Glu-tRNA(Gln) amidotransferase B subunit
MENLFEAVAETAKQERKKGTIRMSELKKQLKERDKKITAIEDQLFLVLKTIGNDEMAALQAKQYAELKIKELKLTYKKIQEEYDMYTVENAEALADVVVEKTTKYVAPVTRGIAQGVRGLGKSLFGFGKDKQ